MLPGMRRTCRRIVFLFRTLRMGHFARILVLHLSCQVWQVGIHILCWENPPHPEHFVTDTHILNKIAGHISPFVAIIPFLDNPNRYSLYFSNFVVSNNFFFKADVDGNGMCDMICQDNTNTATSIYVQYLKNDGITYETRSGGLLGKYV